MITTIIILSALLLAAIAAALGYRAVANAKQRRIETLNEQAGRYLADRDEAIRLMHAAVADSRRIVAEARAQVQAERDAADERVRAEAEAAKAAALINARISSGDVRDIADGLGEALEVSDAG
jgi:hypothetical protein